MAPVINQYSLWRMLPEKELQSLLARGEKGVDPAALFASRDGSAPLIASVADGQPRPAADGAGIYYISSAAGTAAGWEFMTYVDATNSNTYSSYVPTLFDSTASDPGVHYFMVMAHGTEQFTFWESQPESGCSVDNIAPDQPESFSGEQSYNPEGLYLHWGAGGLSAPASDDFSHYTLYRSALPDIEPGPGNIIYQGADAEYFDDEWRWDNIFYYLVSAFDIHGNESGLAYLGPEAITGSETPEAPAASYLAQNAPNPFNPLTTISFGLSDRGRVTLSVYDVTGRLVRVLIDEDRAAGRYRETWDGRGAHGVTVASGVYFYRLRAGTFSETRKMILIR
ncbi:MAG TPA: T9SS type A sorting domain-containing protein [Candidatus Eisenbacteria bacterium]|uniref:T9SS type A sorting domain-containing protein n=1 Tax=Eiseniibacteriota bacterium TaxID=2212470 RepID=A0A7V2ATF5_UNCEI|nr:T9SS type A sorting domain-containing protein [Candidatus Eisenbacteria bacterium]